VCNREIGFDRGTEHDDAVRRPLRGIPWRKSLLQRIEQEISERRKSANREQHDRGNQQPATERG